MSKLKNKYKINYSTNNKKIKYIEKKTIDTCINKEAKKIDTESLLRINKYQNNKSQISLDRIGNDKLMYYQNNYNNIDEKANYQQANRWDGSHFGPGKGFGNLDINNKIRNSNNTRSKNDKFKQDREGLINNRFEIINRPYNPENVLFPFRNGENTRKVSKDTNNSSKNEFIFRY